MGYYSPTIKQICESYAIQQGKPSDIDSLIDAGVSGIFDFQYPIYDEKYRSVLNQKIIEHYFDKEIGLDSLAKFKFHLRTKLREIMPYYNQLYLSTLLEFNPLYDTDYKEEHDGSEKVSSDEDKVGSRGRVKNETDNTTIDSTSTKELDSSETNEYENIGVDNKNRNSNVNVTNDTTKDSNTDQTDHKTSDTNLGGSDRNIYNETVTERKSGSQDGNNSKTTKFSDTPQGSLSGFSDDRYLTKGEVQAGTEHMETSENNTITKDGENTTTYGKTEHNTAELDGNTKTTSTENVDGHTDTVETEKNNFTEQHSGNITDRLDETVTNNSNTNKKNDLTENEKEKETIEKNINSLDSYINHVYGKKSNASYPEMIMKFRESIINVDMLVIEELAELFMLIYPPVG